MRSFAQGKGQFTTGYSGRGDASLDKGFHPKRIPFSGWQEITKRTHKALFIDRKTGIVVDQNGEPEQDTLIISGGKMATYQILYWHDIPIQVRAKDEAGRVGKQLPERFQEAIDEAAMAAKLTADDPYTEGFQWGEEQKRPGSAEDVAAQIIDELDREYDPIDWKATAKKIKKK